MHQETIIYHHDNLKLHGHLVYEESSTGKLPAILIAHAWKGQDSFARQKAQQLAALGYVGFAIDIYGSGQVATSSHDAEKLMLPLFEDRQFLQERLKVAYNVLKEHPKVDAQCIGGIGFCFGGLAIIELFRSGVDLRGVVSFHALLGAKCGNTVAKVVPIQPNIKGSMLILHGHDDPLVSTQDIQTIQQELTEAEIDWQMHIYGQTSHAFSVPEANDKSLGLLYNQSAERRSWLAMKNFFLDVFS